MPDTTVTTTTTTDESTEDDSLSIYTYIDDTQLDEMLAGGNVEDIEYTVSQIMSTRTNGIEGLPYQFLPSVDRRVPGADVGRKYGDKIFARLPLLFLTPCEPLFMDDFGKQSKKTIAEKLLGNDNVNSSLLNESGKYYSVRFNYADYYGYLNTMLAVVAKYMGIQDTEISIGGKEPKKISAIAWQNELNDSFKTYFSCAENIVFYLDDFTSVSESFSNDTSASSIESTINQFTDVANELKFLFGSSGNVAAELISSASDVASGISSSLSEVASSLAGGIVGTIADKGVNSVLNGGKIMFPEIWSNSTYDKSYSINIKLRSPDNDNLSIFLNILKPYCKILALTLPRIMKNSDTDEQDPNSYGAPFLVKAACKGMFSIDMGIISSLSVTKGAQCCWNDDGLPTQIDISLDIKDLYSHMAMSSMQLITSDGFDATAVLGVVNNTSYMDFLANMAGLNLLQMELGRRITMVAYLSKAVVTQSASNIFTRFDQGVSRLLDRLYKVL